MELAGHPLLEDRAEPAEELDLCVDPEVCLVREDEQVRTVPFGADRVPGRVIDPGRDVDAMDADADPIGERFELGHGFLRLGAAA